MWTILAQTAPVEGTPHVWHFWLSVALAAATILTVLGILGMYLFKVTRSRYPDS
jgi:hypothetical protein